MPQKKVVMVGMIVGSIVGSYVPVLLGAGTLSLWSLFAGGVGGIAGIWFAYRLTQ